MKCKIICDGSFDRITGLCGIAYAIEVNEEEVIKNALTIAEVKDPNEGEMYAIQFALLALRSYLRFRRAESLEIISDSATSFLCLNETNFNPFTRRAKYTEIISDINHTLGQITSPENILLSKVKAHVDDVISSQIEYEHNIIDALAKNKLRVIRDPIRYPTPNHNKVCLLNVPGNCNRTHREQLKILIKLLIKKGYQIRMPATDRFSFIDHFTSPLFQNKVKIFQKVDNDTHLIQTDPSYERGTLRALLKSYIEFSGLEFNSFIRNVDTTVINAAESAGMLLTGINDEQSEFLLPGMIVDLVDDEEGHTQTMSYWLTNYASYLQVPRFYDLKDAYKHINGGRKSLSVAANYER